MNIFKSYVADTPVNVYWLVIDSHPVIDRIISEDGRQIHIDGGAYELILKYIKEEMSK
jgi:hypothetical protein